MPNKIDLDAGVMVSRMPQNKGGMYVYMYMQKPGEYINEHGHRVSEALAKEVGFDVDKWNRVALKNKRLAEAKAKIEAELDLITEEIENTVKEAAGFKLISVEGDRYVVKDPEGVMMTQFPVPLPDAEAVFTALTDVDAKTTKTPVKKGV